MESATDRFVWQLVSESEPLSHDERLEAAALVDSLLSGSDFSAPFLEDDAPVPPPLYWDNVVAPVPADRTDLTSSSSRRTQAESLPAPASPEMVEAGAADSSPECCPVGTEEGALFRSHPATEWWVGSPRSPHSRVIGFERGESEGGEGEDGGTPSVAAHLLCSRLRSLSVQSPSLLSPSASLRRPLRTLAFAPNTPSNASPRRVADKTSTGAEGGDAVVVEVVAVAEEESDETEGETEGEAEGEETEEEVEEEATQVRFVDGGHVEAAEAAEAAEAGRGTREIVQEIEPRRSPTWEMACGQLWEEEEETAEQQQQQQDDDEDEDEEVEQSPVERRRDGDEGEFTWSEFVSFYGAAEGRAAWRAARPAVARPAAARLEAAPGRGAAETLLEVTALRWAARRERGVGGETWAAAGAGGDAGGGAGGVGASAGAGAEAGAGAAAHGVAAAPRGGVLVARRRLGPEAVLLRLVAAELGKHSHSKHSRSKCGHSWYSRRQFDSARPPLTRR